MSDQGFAVSRCDLERLRRVNAEDEIIHLPLSPHYMELDEFRPLVDAQLISAIERLAETFSESREEMEQEALDTVLARLPSGVSVDAVQNVFRAQAAALRRETESQPVFVQMNHLTLLRSGESLLLLHMVPFGLPQVLMASHPVRKGPKQAPPNKEEGDNPATPQDEAKAKQDKYQNDMIVWTAAFVGELVLGLLGVIGVKLANANKLNKVIKTILESNKLRKLLNNIISGLSAGAVIAFLKGLYDEGVLGDILKELADLSGWGIAILLVNLALILVPGGQWKILASIGLLVADLLLKVAKIPEKPK